MNVQARLKQLQQGGGCPRPEIDQRFQDTRDGDVCQVVGYDGSIGRDQLYSETTGHYYHESKESIFNWYRPL